MSGYLFKEPSALDLPQRAQEAVILFNRSRIDPETVLEALAAALPPDEDPALLQLIVNLPRVGDLEEKEVRLAGEDLSSL